jgi:zinc and cadmium transporter
MDPYLSGGIAVALVSLVSLVGVTTLAYNETLLKRAVFLLISLSAGALLGDAFIHILPEAFASADPLQVSLLVLAGVLSFFVLEKLFHWHHSHGDEEFSPEHARIHPVGKLVIISDGVHNFVDGLAIGAAFLITPEVGIATTIAIALHEIPQEIGDFGLLIHAGFSRMKALLFNFASALTAFVGLAVAFFVGQTNDSLIVLITAFAAGNFIYIALADIVPELQKTQGIARAITQLLFIGIGIGAMILMLGLE